MRGGCCGLPGVEFAKNRGRVAGDGFAKLGVDGNGGLSRECELGLLGALFDAVTDL